MQSAASASSSLSGKILGWLCRPFRLVFGQLSWTAPLWLQSINRYARKSPAKFAGGIVALLLLSAAIAGGYWYYQQLPKPVQVKARVLAPATGHYIDNTEQPTPLILRFRYDPSNQPASVVAPDILASARLDLIGEVLGSGVTLNPEITGKWLWQDDNTLVFTPDSAWPAGKRYRVQLTNSIFAPEITLSEHSYSFDTPAFSVQAEQLRFYQDPTDHQNRRVAATLKFSHPVMVDSIRERLELTMRPSGADIRTRGQAVSYQLTADKNGRDIYLLTDPIALPDKEQYLALKLNDGVKAVNGGGTTRQGVEQQLLVPDRYSFLKVSQLRADIIRNMQDEPEQILNLELTDRITRQEMLKKLRLYQLPEHPQRKNYYWQPGEVTEAVLQQATLLPLTLLPGQYEHDNAFSIRLDVPEGRSVFVSVPAGLQSVSQFLLNNEYRNVAQAPYYPREARIMGEGAILSLSGEQKLQLVTRGVPGVKVRLFKLLPDQLNHFVSQTRGDISHPYFNSYNFDASNISSVSEQEFTLPAGPASQANYLALALKPHLTRSGMGVYFIELREFNPEYPEQEGRELDKRVVLVTDLGLIVKHNADSSQQVFVMSVADGKPVANAKVELLGKNGVALFNQRTDGQGQVSFGKVNEFYREQQPVVYLVSRQRDGITDSTFIPFDRYSRQLDYSKFNTDGSYEDQQSQQALNAFIFSDRGIYRPGEQIQLASIIRQGDLALPATSKLPLQINIHGPRGNVFWQQNFALAERGFNSFTVDSHPHSDTGSYWVSIQLLDNRGRVQRQLGSVSFQLEEFQPDTLRISSRFVPEQQLGWLSPEQLQAQVQLDNLFGTPAQQRRVTGRIELVPGSFRFNQYQDYRFVDVNHDNSRVERLRETLPEQQTDADGKAVFDLPLTQYSGGTYRLMFHTEGFDSAGGRSVQASNSALVSPLKQLVGFKADGDLSYLKKQQQRQLHFIAINPALEQIALPQLQLKLVEKRPLSSLVKQQDGTYQYQTVIQEQVRSEQVFEIAADGSSYTVPADEPGDYELQVFNQEQQLLSKVLFSVVGNANLAARLEQNATLQVKPDKADYKAGDWIELNITAPYTGSGLITIETHKVHAFSWFSTDSTSSMQRIRLPQGLEGNAYINVSFVRGTDAKELFISPLSYAVVPFSIDRSSRELGITLEAPAEVRPGKPFTVGYQADQPADILIYGVDEGILQVAAYRLPDPLAFYLKKRALLVRSMQMLDLILPEFTALQRYLAGVGGDQAALMAERAMLARNLNPFSRRTEQPGVFWLGILSAEQQMKYQQVSVPASFSGNIKLMAVAVSDTAMATKSQDIQVRGPFVLMPDVLTMAAPGDEFDVSVTVANGVKGSGNDAPIRVTLQSSELLEVTGKQEQLVNISEGSESSVRFRVKALAAPGEASLTFSASWTQGELTEQAERSSSLSIRPVSAYQATTQIGYARKGPLTLDTRYPLYQQHAQQSVVASASPLVVAGSLTSYLEQYPHGCTEQVVSQVFPWLPLIQQPAYQAQLPQLQEKFTVLIQKLAERQQSDGGFSFWPGGYISADFPSVYVMHFLLEAREQGLAVPDYLFGQGLNYLRGLARQSGANLYQARLRAYAIYLLSRSGEVTTNYLTELHERLEKQHKQAWQSDITAIYMAATYQLLQKQDLAAGLLPGYRLGRESSLQKQYLNGQRIAVNNFTNPAYQSQLSLDAQYVYLLAQHFPEQAVKLEGEQVTTLFRPLFNGDYNTIGAAYAVLALSAYEQDTDDNIRFSVLNEQGDKTTLPAPDKHKAVMFDHLAKQLLLESSEPFFYAMTESGFSASNEIEAIREQLEIVRDYLDEDGKVVTSAIQGQQLTVRLRLRSLNGEWLPNIAVTDLLPGGFEVIRSSVPRQQGPWSADYLDIREDRLVWYAGFGAQSTELRYQVKVVAAGDFAVPAASAESMYDRRIKAGTTTGRFRVTAAAL
ncbi:alpha-2-macroglobulin [Chromatiaceae bacterium AAb-1]|nr:alpha-2-macroglobulin [Chromatiaceae bacterium AAb-1]